MVEKFKQYNNVVSPIPNSLPRGNHCIEVLGNVIPWKYSTYKAPSFKKKYRD